MSISHSVVVGVMSMDTCSENAPSTTLQKKETQTTTKTRTASLNPQEKDDREAEDNQPR
jgi:hypothetical protein